MTPVLYSDADNTLWETDAVYRRAHLWLFGEAVARSGITANVDDPVGFVRAIDQELAESHPAGLRYPPSLLVNQLLRRMSGGEYAPPEGLANEIAGEFTKMTDEAPALREGVQVGLQRLSLMKCPVRVITETSLQRCERLLRLHHIADYVASVDSVTKDDQYFLGLKRQVPVNSRGWVVGDQLSSDILPARNAGFQTVYFPGSFQPRWEQDLILHPDIFQVTSFADIPAIIKNHRDDDQLASAVSS